MSQIADVLGKFPEVTIRSCDEGEVILNITSEETMRVILDAYGRVGSGLSEISDLVIVPNPLNSPHNSHTVRIIGKQDGALDSVADYFARLVETNIFTHSDMELTYCNNLGRKSYQWEVWAMCDNLCKFCYLGKTNRNTDTERQLKSLRDCRKAVENLDYGFYNNLSFIGGEFFQGQLDVPEVHTEFMELMETVARMYETGRIGSVWITATLTKGDQKHLYETIEIFKKHNCYPKPEYGASGLWICTSWDAEGRFHTPAHKENWEFHMKNMKQKYPWIKLNTTIILMEKFIQMYLDGEWNLAQFEKEFSTTLFFKQGGFGEVNYLDYGEWDTTEHYSEMVTKIKAGINERFGMEFLPKRETFLKFLKKFATEYPDHYQRLFNIQFRADELHRNFNDVAEVKVNVRFKGAKSESNAIEDAVTNSCGHLFSYAAYSDCNKCCICDRVNIWKYVHGE